MDGSAYTDRVREDFDRLADLPESGGWDHNAHYHPFLLKQLPQGTNTRFVVSTRSADPKELYEFYARRGESENWNKDLKLALKADRLSCQSVYRQPVSTSHLCHAERHAR